MIGLRFCATQPESPCPNGMRSDSNRRKLSPLTCSRIQPSYRAGHTWRSSRTEPTPQLHGENGKGFVETERSAQILAEFEQHLRLLPGGCDGRKERCFLALCAAWSPQASSRRNAAFDYHVGREFRPFSRRALAHHVRAHDSGRAEPQTTMGSNASARFAPSRSMTSSSGSARRY